MAIYSGLTQKLLQKIHPHLPHFALELLLIFILLLTVGANINLRANSETTITNRSLFFSYLKNHADLNQPLVDAYDAVNIKLAASPDLTKQVLAASTLEKPASSQDKQSAPLPTLAGLALLKPNPAASDGLLPKRDIEVYQVRGGDTVSAIAASFGVTPETILWENNLSATSLLRPGQELRILPTSGVKHSVKTGENLYSIAKSYGVDLDIILDYNEIEIPEHIFAGDEIIIPNGIKKAPPTPSRRQYLANLEREDYQTASADPGFQASSSGLIWPAPSCQSLSRGFLRYHRAVDVPCRYLAIVASADGVVVETGYKGAYGNEVLLDHGNGMKTRYAHLSKITVAAGQQVSQGQTLGISGSTGRSSGPHLHFEVLKNGLLINPLGVVSR